MATTTSNKTAFTALAARAAIAFLVAPLGICSAEPTQGDELTVRGLAGSGDQAPLLGSLPTTAGYVAKDGETGRLPALGWNSWNAFFCDINEEKFMVAANQIVKLGLKDAGYTYVNIDDCWSIGGDHRDPATQRMVPDPFRFPSGIASTAKKVHDLGLKIGIYSSAGTRTCAGYPASLGYEKVDAESFADWGIDYLKYDNCNVPSDWADECSFCIPDSGHWPHGPYPNGTCPTLPNQCPPDYDWKKSKTAERYRCMRDALDATNRTILYSLCEWGTAGVQKWGNETSMSWRATGDITWPGLEAKWERIAELLNICSFNLDNTDFWGHSDADMLEVGNGGLTPAEARSHFALWAAMKSPLLIGTQLDKIPADDLAILKNRYLLAFNQDPIIGKPATPYKWGTNPDHTFNATYPAEYWSGQSKDGMLVLMGNWGANPAKRTAVWGEVPGLDKDASYRAVDVWTGKSLGCHTGEYSVDVKRHDTAVIFITGKCAQRVGQHLSGKN
ncbi:alpha-galactosidase 1 [Eremomyces bilateralis CBS 781.70]|uniref:Alpha-galactosidase n=1 Tax=Eremomyces bilateralis CBS 781.70 TaxID=1392243 RepID=A0A6G1FQ95_9PEZI|nr:alpha-galactosidase 1 [Eremomyces bilateralis CBS 781.70]KAF1807859.1 alpha-galactosidase 1 [Eremomyces bilateralis CBS 781.70]